MKKRYDAVLCAVLGGFFGLHKFYLGERVAGILRAVFFFTLIPAVLAYIDALVLLFSTDEKFDKKYNCGLSRIKIKTAKTAEQAYETLSKLKALYESGEITEQEYAKLKNTTLGKI